MRARTSRVKGEVWPALIVAAPFAVALAGAACRDEPGEEGPLGASLAKADDTGHDARQPGEPPFLARRKQELHVDADVSPIFGYGFLQHAPTTAVHRVLFRQNGPDLAQERLAPLPGLFNAHHQAFNVMLLRDRDELIDTAGEVAAQINRQRLKILFRHHEVVKLVMARSGGIDTKHHDRPRDRRRMSRSTMNGERRTAGYVAHRGIFLHPRDANCSSQISCGGNISCFQSRPSMYWVPGATTNGPMSSVTSTPVRLKASDVILRSR